MGAATCLGPRELPVGSISCVPRMEGTRPCSDKETSATAGPLSRSHTPVSPHHHTATSRHTTQRSEAQMLHLKKSFVAWCWGIKLIPWFRAGTRALRVYKVTSKASSPPRGRCGLSRNRLPGSHTRVKLGIWFSLVCMVTPQCHCPFHWRGTRRALLSAQNQAGLPPWCNTTLMV